LDVAAQDFGCRDYNHALLLARQAQRAVVELHETIFSADWSDSESRTSGVEIYRAWLPKPWRELVSLGERRMTRHLSFFRIAGLNRLVARYGYDLQSAARERIVSAVRELTFASITGLRPALAPQTKRAFPQQALDDGRTKPIHIPGQDHASVWCDSNGAAVIVDEPYEGEREATSTARQAWCDAHGYEWLSPNWTGIHAPHLKAQMLIYARREDGAVLRRLGRALASAEAPIYAEPWKGESVINGAGASHFFVQ
jgi:hypothetical protein